MSQIETNKEIVGAFLDAMNRGDTAAILEAYAEDGQVVQMKEYMDTELATDIICGGRRP